MVGCYVTLFFCWFGSVVHVGCSLSKVLSIMLEHKTQTRRFDNGGRKKNWGR